MNNKIAIFSAVFLLLANTLVSAQQEKKSDSLVSSVAATVQPPGESNNLKNQNADLEKEVDRLNVELREAYAKYLKLLQEHQKLLKSPYPQKEELYMELGDAYTKAKLYAAAITAYEGALELNPRNAQAHYSLGLLYKQHRNDVPRALLHFKKCLKVEPEFVHKGDVEYMIKMFEKNEEFHE